MNHPNILTIYEIGECDYTHYIVSEFINGKTLREILRKKTLSMSETLDISIQIANALFDRARNKFDSPRHKVAKYLKF